MYPLWIEGSADEVVVVVKLEAVEDMVTYQRIKLPESDGKKNHRRQRTEHENRNI